MLHLEHGFVWYWNLDASVSRSELTGKLWNVVLEKDGEDTLNRPCEKNSYISANQKQCSSLVSSPFRRIRYVDREGHCNMQYFRDPSSSRPHNYVPNSRHNQVLAWHTKTLRILTQISQTRKRISFSNLNGACAHRGSSVVTGSLNQRRSQCNRAVGGAVNETNIRTNC